MRLSCNGCRVLRKGCTEDCKIRPCLEWIKCPYSQGNATVFLAKFYGRAGLLNLIDAGPPNLRPAIFRSLLYEACGRIVNPINGSVGLLWSGSWQLCHDAVEAVLRGDPITQITADAAETKNGPPLKAYDIRHVSKDDNNYPNRVRNRKRHKRVKRSPSHESSLSHQSEPNSERVSPECNSVASAEGEIELDLTLGMEPFKKPTDLAPKRDVGSADDDAGFCRMKLGLDYSTA